MSPGKGAILNIVAFIDLFLYLGCSAKIIISNARGRSPSAPGNMLRYTSGIPNPGSVLAEDSKIRGMHPPQFAADPFEHIFGLPFAVICSLSRAARASCG